jgi:RNA polymerase sigma factor (sigma-70 family)
MDMENVNNNSNSFDPAGQGPDPELQLLARVRQREKWAFEELYRRYFKKIYRFSARILRDTSHTEDVINETMYVVWNKPFSFDGTCRLSTWIFGIAFNKARKYADPRMVMRAADDDDSDEIDNNEIATNCSLELLENRELVEFALTALSDEQRAVVELTYFHDFSYREIALIMQCSENTVKTRMFYARKKLYEKISETHSR